MNTSAYYFRNNFILYPDPTPIVLYGLGKNTEDILLQCEDDRIIGVLDGFREDGYFCGKPILALNDLCGMAVKIVIVARTASERIIYKRIQRFCRENGIVVYNLNGEDLGVRKFTVDHPYFKKNGQDLLELAEAYDTISFDIFDTLLTRKISNREGLYSLIGQVGRGPNDFAKVRLSAEYELSAMGCPTLAEIYEQIKLRCQLSAEDIKLLMDTELSIELWNLTPREELVQVFNQLIAAGKRVYLVSDMYFDKTFLDGVLNHCGISGYQGLFVSCEYGTDKSDGLFEIYKNVVKGSNYFHIGDSVESDEASAKRCGIEGYLVKSAGEMAELTDLDVLPTEEFSEDILKNMVISQLFRSPFALFENGGRIHMKDYFAVGYAILGPIVTGYVQWLISKTQGNLYEKICFVSRDGYLFKRVYELMATKRNIPQAIYLETSRHLSVIASLMDEDDVEWAFQFPFSGTAEERLAKQLGLERDTIMAKEDGEDDGAYLNRHKTILLQHAKHTREIYKQFLDGYNLIAGRTALFDFVSTGTCQVGLEKIMGFPLQGFYFDKIDNGDPRKSNLNIHAYIQEMMPGQEMPLYFMLENWIKETKPSVINISEDGDVIRGENHMHPEQVSTIEQIQKGAIDFCRDLLFIEECNIDMDIQKWALMWLDKFTENNFCIEEMQWPIYDEFTGRQI